MSEFDATGVEELEVTDPVEEETGEEEQEVTEPASEETAEDSEKKSADAAFAKMRREKEEAQKELQAAKAEIERLMAQDSARASAYERLTGSEDGEISAIAEALGMSEDEVRATMEEAEEQAQRELENAQLKKQIESLQADMYAKEDLTEIQKIDPTVASLEDLGDDFPSYISAGLSPQQAYWAVKAQETATKATPPKVVGKVATGAVEKDYYSEAEIEAMSSEQLTKNYKKIIASWDRMRK